MKQILVLVCTGVAVAGCGQKGPLYLPDKNASVITRPAPAAAAPAPASGTAPGAPKPEEDKKDDSQSSSPPPR
ncbi:MAG TPA: lipoprotein [Steroidobacteraceae bacterium]|nr:lipoprotein [Steroidobacteraceae bacterium]